MKAKFYTLFILVLYHVFFIGSAKAQCNCEGDKTPQQVVHTITLDSITALNTVVSFPQISPDSGTLVCINIQSWATTVLTMDLENKEPFEVEYMMRYTRLNSISAPGINVFADIQNIYGPYSLTAFEQSQASVQIGPDTVFRNTYLSRTNNSNVVPYLGTGTVNFVYTNTGSALMLNGSNNYNLNVAAYSNVHLELTYVFCPQNLLALGIKNFGLKSEGNTALLNWEVQQSESNSVYEVEYSTGGKDFTSAGVIDKKHFSNGKYQYSYLLNNQFEMYFRIKQTSPDGKVSYSATRKFVRSSTLEQPLVTSYPNPVTDRLKVQYNRILNGDYLVELINNKGQVVLKQMQRISSVSTLNVQLGSRPPAGIYFLRIRNTRNGMDNNTTKVIVK